MKFHVMCIGIKWLCDVMHEFLILKVSIAYKGLNTDGQGEKWH